MKTIPKFTKGVFRRGLKLSLQEIAKDPGLEVVLLASQVDVVPTSPGGLVAKARLQERVSMFAAGDWVTLLQTSLDASIKGTTARCRRRKGQRDTIQARAARALSLAHMGELSNARQALEGCIGTRDGEDVEGADRRGETTSNRERTT